MPLRTQFLRQRDDLSRARERVVGVDQERVVLREALGEMPERFRLVRVRLDKGMRHRPVQRNPELAARLDRRRARESGKVRRPRREHARLGPMCAPQPEVHEHPALCRQHAARGLARDHRLQVQQVDQARLDELRLGQRGRDAHDGLIGERDRPLRQGIHVAREP